MSADRPFTKENLDGYLKELGKEFRKRNGKVIPAEIILIGGAAVLINYGFREMTNDIDAIIHASSAMDEAIRAVEDKMSLPYGWINTDFMKTTSYTPKLERYSKYYKTFSNILQVRTVSAEYLVAMKLMSGRQYKNDLSDVVGILIEQKERNDTLTFERIKQAIEDLYDDYNFLPENSRKFIESLLEKEDIRKFYKECRKEELENKDILVEFQDNYPGVMNGNNLSEILRAARKKKEMSK